MLYFIIVYDFWVWKHRRRNQSVPLPALCLQLLLLKATGCDVAERNKDEDSVSLFLSLAPGLCLRRTSESYKSRFSTALPSSRMKLERKNRREFTKVTFHPKRKSRFHLERSKRPHLQYCLQIFLFVFAADVLHRAQSKIVYCPHYVFLICCTVR